MLNALQLAGFKSFADRTHFAFPEGITVVVGPNGSGKSNVVDAIKWVMGEQSARSLRGGEMADVIFKGSAGSGRKPANTAEATLIFDNHDRRLDVDADEVHVTRRVFRSGEGEYLINKRPCRLRDIKDMFRGTGMGAGAYSLIEQGKVDTLLQASPRDRRAIFEEAAGISRFKAKKVEAQRRLERVDQNLLRLSDIVEELEGRLRSLRSQATKARRYGQYTERLQQLRTQVGLADYRRMRQELSEVQAMDVEGEIRVATVAAECESGEAQRLEADTELELLGEKIRSAENQVAAHRQRFAALRATVESDLRRLYELCEEQSRLGKSLVSLRRNTGDAGQKLDDASRQLREAETAREELGQAVERERASLDAFNRHLLELQMRVETSREAHLTCIRDSSDLESQIKQWTLRHDEQVNAAQAAYGRLREAIAQMQTADAERCDHHQSLQQIAESDGQARDRLVQLRQDLGQTRDGVDAMQERMAHRRAAFEGLRERAAVLEELESRQEGLNEGTKALLQRAEDTASIYGDVCGMVADLIRVDVEVAQLVDAALGERSQFLVVRGERLIDAIKSAQVTLPGRVAIIPLSSWQDAPASLPVQDWETLPGVLGRAHQFVETESEFAGLIDGLLGNIWFAERLSDIPPPEPGHPPIRWITSTGDICEPDGTVVLGGFRSRHQIVSRRSELRKLREEMRTLEDGIDRDTLHIQQQRDRLVALQHEVESQQQQADAVRDELQKERVESQRRDQKCQVARDTHAAALKELRTARLNGQLAVEERAELQRRLTLLKASFASRGQELTDLTTQLKEDAEKRDGDMDALTQQNAEFARRQQSAKHCREQVERLRREQVEGERVALELSQQQARCRRALEQTEQDLLAANAEVAELAQCIDQDEALLRRCRRQQASILERRRSLKTQLDKLRAEQRRMDHAHQQNQLHLERLTNQLDALLSRYREDFELDLEKLEADPDAEADPQREEVESEIAELRRKISNIGAVNMEALRDLQALESRYEELAGQHNDLQSAKESLGRIITKINADSRRLFAETLQQIRENFRAMFRKVFGGGEADIVLEDDEDLLESGIDIVATPPGKQSLRLSLLSGGERALTAVTLLLAIFQYRPSPFCVLDEVDGPLDEANIGRFIQVLNEFLGHTKFVIVTHSKVTMTAADTLYGITMEESGISKQVSVRFEDVSEDGQIRTVEDDERVA